MRYCLLHIENEHLSTKYKPWLLKGLSSEVRFIVICCPLAFIEAKQTTVRLKQIFMQDED